MFLFLQFLQKYDDKFIFDQVHKYVSLKSYGSGSMGPVRAPAPTKSVDQKLCSCDQQTTCQFGGKNPSATSTEMKGEGAVSQKDNQNAKGDGGQRLKRLFRSLM